MELILTKKNRDEIKDLLSEVILEIIKPEIEKLALQKPVPEEDRLLSRRECCKLLLISLPTLDRLSRGANNVLTAYRLGGNKIRYKRSEVLAALKVVQTTKYKKQEPL